MNCDCGKTKKQKFPKCWDCTKKNYDQCPLCKNYKKKKFELCYHCNQQLQAAKNCFYCHGTGRMYVTEDYYADCYHDGSFNPNTLEYE